MDGRLVEAFEAVPRRDFLPKSQRRFAHHDNALEIGYGATNSQPTTVRNMLALLDVQPGHRVLDVGSGSGWSTALLAHLVGPGGEVVGVEIVPQLVELGRANLRNRPCASIHQAVPDVLGWPKAAPYDRILVSAAASRIPDELLEQLADPGVMVVPVKGVMRRLIHDAAGALTVEEHGFYSFVPLRGG